MQEMRELNGQPAGLVPRMLQRRQKHLQLVREDDEVAAGLEQSELEVRKDGRRVVFPGLGVFGRRRTSRGLAERTAG